MDLPEAEDIRKLTYLLSKMKGNFFKKGNETGKNYKTKFVFTFYCSIPLPNNTYEL